VRNTLLILASVCACGTGIAQEAGVVAHESEIPNLGLVKHRIRLYHDSGQWAEDISTVAAQAVQYLKAQPRRQEPLAVVIDIDETALSKYEQMNGADFAFLPSFFQEWYVAEKSVAQQPILDFYRAAVQAGCAVFFISGRREMFRSATESNLRKAGYTSWQAVILRPNDDDSPSVIPYKTQARKKIVEDGYAIVVNIGDQYSDLEGGYAEGKFKISNPAYYIR
jgi:acid phosphatase